MASNIQEVFWMIDADTKRALYINPAYETITGRSRQSLIQNPFSCEEMIYPEDRAHVLAAFDEATRNGEFHREISDRLRTERDSMGECPRIPRTGSHG